MAKKNVLIWGCGSIGMRHALLAQELGADVLCVSSNANIPFARVASVDAVDPLAEFDLAVIATPTALHANHLQLMQGLNAKKILIEKPLFSVVDTECQKWAAGLPADNLFVAYNLRFHPGVRRLVQLLHGKRLLSLHLHVGQYLPSWRPEQDYRQSYSASTSLGGGVLRDLSHELDLACLLGGAWQRVAALGGKLSDLLIESDDSFNILAVHERCPQVSIHLDYQQFPARRFIVAVWENGGAKLDFINGTLTCGDSEECFTVPRDATYRCQMSALVEDAASESILCSFEQGLDVVNYVCAAEKAAARGEWIWRKDL